MSNSFSIQKLEIIPQIFYDEDTTPFDFECYSDEEIKNWENDLWFYVGLRAKAIITLKSDTGFILTSEIGSNGLYGIDFDHSDNAYKYLLEVYDEELNNILLELEKTDIYLRDMYVMLPDKHLFPAGLIPLFINENIKECSIQ